MAQLLLCGEGPHEIGRREWSVRAEDTEITEGWLQPLVTRLRASAGDTATVSLKELVTFPGRRPPRPRGDLARKAQLAMFRAMEQGCSGVVFATDADSTEPSDQARKVRAIEEGFASVPDRLAGAACVPMGTSEAWLLADAAAWRRLGATDLRKLPRQPEETWGRPHDPASGHPKSLFEAVSKANRMAADQDLRAELARRLSISVVTAQCRRSFGPFRDAMGQL
jgi:hypothetical protein